MVYQKGRFEILLIKVIDFKHNPLLTHSFLTADLSTANDDGRSVISCCSTTCL